MTTARPSVLGDALAHASGRSRRTEPTLPRTGGPSGNAQLTAWLGLLMLVLFLAQLLTLFNVSGLITWHVAIGALLVPPALAKTATTTWKLIRYYTGSPAYQESGPPPALLRLLGPLVVFSTLILLMTGIVLVSVGEGTGRQPFTTILGHGISWLTLHQVCFIAWATFTGLHLLGRFVPALRYARTPATGHDGKALRALVLLALVGSAALVAVLLVSITGSWDHHGDHVGPPQGSIAVRATVPSSWTTSP